MSGSSLTAAMPSSPVVWTDTGEARIEWRTFFSQLWQRTGGSAGSVPPGGGTITGVTAGTGLAGGGTSGTVTVSLNTPVLIGLGGTSATTPAQALTNLGALPIAGGTMTGPLVLAGDPSVNLNPVTLEYFNTNRGMLPGLVNAANDAAAAAAGVAVNQIYRNGSQLMIRVT